MSASGVADCVITDSPGQLIRVVWSAMTTIRNLLEDAEGADGRIDYLRGVQLSLFEAVQIMDGGLAGPAHRVGADHRLATLLERGAPMLDITAEQVRDELAYAGTETDPAALATRILAWGETVLDRLPGAVPEAQGPQGTREVLTSLRRWSALCERTGQDFAFMSSLLRDL